MTEPWPFQPAFNAILVAPTRDTGAAAECERDRATRPLLGHTHLRGRRGSRSIDPCQPWTMLRRMAVTRFADRFSEPLPSLRMLRTLIIELVAGLLPAVVFAQAPAQPGSTPSLLVFITVDQMRPDYFTRFESQLTGGLARLYRGGAVFTNAFQDHGITETAPGHASTMSGRFPRSTGIVQNSAGVEDPTALVIGGGAPGASPKRFRGTTLIDWL